MAHATLDVRLLGVPEVVALLRAAADVVDLALEFDAGASEAPARLIDRALYTNLRAAVRVFIPEPDDATVGGSD